MIKRFQERIKDVEISGQKISNKSLDVFLELYEKHSAEPELGITIDTSNISVEETFHKVNH